MNTRSKKKVTIEDIARECNTSIATVSRALNNPNYAVSEISRQKVFEAAKKLEYEMPSSASINRREYENSLGIIVPSFHNSYFVQLVNGISQNALSAGFIPYIFCSQRNKNYERSVISRLIESRINILMIESIDNSSKYIKRYVNAGGKVCLFSSGFDEHIPGVIRANTDMVNAGKIAMKHLIDCGHKKIAVISAPITTSNRRDLLAGCMAVSITGNKSFGQDNVYQAEHEGDINSAMYDHDTIKKLIDQVLGSKTKYSAILAFNDYLAVGIIKELHSRGIRIPEDVSVMGVDDIPIASIISPALTTVDVSSEVLGGSSSQMLIDSLKKKKSDLNIDIVVQPQLVKRQSVKTIGII